MQIATDDNCHKEFEDMKFRKTPTRSIVYKIDKEKIVAITISYIGHRTGGTEGRNLG